MKRAVVTAIVSIILSSTLYGQESSEGQLVWPPPPEPERIRYLYCLSVDRDVEGEPSWIEDIWNFIVGADEERSGLVQPVGAAVDEEGRLFVTDPGARCIHMFDRENEEYDRISETAEGLLVSPIGIAFGPEGMMYVSDSEQRSVIAYEEDGGIAFEITGRFTRPTGLCILNDTLYVVDTGANAVLCFTLSGEFLVSFGTRGVGEGQFNFPVFCTAGEHLYVVDAMNYRIQTFTGAGVFRSTFGEQGTTIGRFSSPKGIALDSDENIYIADAMFDVLQIFNRSGDLLLVVGGAGSNHGQFYNPTGVTIDVNDQVYVVDALNKRVEVFQYVKGE